MRPRVRVLYVPFFSNLNLAGCSIFNNMKVLFRELVERHEDVQIFYPYPNDPTFDVSAMKFLDHPRIKQIPCSALRLQSEDVNYLPLDLIEKFKTTTGEYHLDLVICDKPRMTSWLDLTLNDHIRAVGGNVPIVNFNQYPAAREGRTEHYSEAFEYAQVMGWFGAWNIWTGKQDYEMCLRAARKYATARVVKRIMDQSFHGVTTVVDCTRIDKLSKEKPKDKILVNYASRFGSHYEFEEIFEEVEYLYQAGRDTKLVITSPSPRPGNVGNRVMRELEHRKMNYDLNFKCPQEEFYGKASQCHVSLWLIKEMGASLSLREQVYMRQAVVVPRTPIYEEMLPGYPYMYEDKAQMRTLLRHLVENYWSPEVQAVVEKYRAHVANTYGAEKGVDALYTFLKARVDETVNYHESIAGMMKAAFDALGWPEEMTYDQLREIVRKGTETKRDVEINYTGFSRNFFRWALPEIGYVDTHQDFKPTWKRVTRDGSPVPPELRK